MANIRFDQVLHHARHTGLSDSAAWKEAARLHVLQAAQFAHARINNAVVTSGNPLRKIEKAPEISEAGDVGE